MKKTNRNLAKAVSKLSSAIRTMVVHEIAAHTGMKVRRVERVLAQKSTDIRDIAKVAYAVGLTPEVSLSPAIDARTKNERSR